MVQASAATNRSRRPQVKVSAISGTSMDDTWAPSEANTSPVARTAAATSGATSSKNRVSQKAMRRPLTPRCTRGAVASGATPAVVSSSGSGPCRASKARAQSSTARARGPTESSVGLRGYTPLRPMRPTVVFSPAMPHRAAGMRTEPPVSLPMATGASPAATATAEPDEEPPGTRWVPRSQGFHGVPAA